MNSTAAAAPTATQDKGALGTWLVLSAIFVASVGLPLPGRDGRIGHLPSVCPFYALTGLPCPGCGLTRAFVCLGHGHFVNSLHWHPLGWLVASACLAWWAVLGASLARRRPPPALPPRLERGLSYSALAGFLLVGIGRMAWLLAHHQPWPGAG